MAAITATVVGFELLRGDDRASMSETTARLKCGVLYLDNQSGSNVAGGTDTLDLAAAATSIQNQLRNGKTVTVRKVQLFQNALVNAAGARTSLAGTVTISGGTISVAPTAVSDYSTNATWTGTGTTERPYGVLVAFSEA